MKRMACAIAFATGTGMVLGGSANAAATDPTPATAPTGLQLTIVSPGLITSDAPSNIDVNFRGGTIRSVELYVDSSRVFKKTVSILDSHGNFNLQIDNSLLPEGDHDVMVVATEPDGSTATSSIKVHVSGPQVDGIAQVAYPRADAVVQNVVPIELKLDPGIRTPYVAYLLDNDFVGVRNYAPYVYNWDSSKVSDGPHTITIEVYDSVTQDLLKRMSVRVVVKNVGGFTKLQPRIAVNSKTAQAATTGIRAVIGEALAVPTFSAIEPGTITHNAGISVVSSSVRGTEPHSMSVFAPAETRPASIIPVKPASPEYALEPTSPSGIATSAMPRNPQRITGAPLMMNIAEMVAEPVLATVTQETSASRISRITVKPLHSGNIATKPAASLAPVASVDNLAPASVVPVQHVSSLRAARLTVHPMVITPYLAPPVAYVRAHRVNGLKTFDVAFNNMRIAFDVQPRVENGLTLAPFRAIVESSGGSVKWYGKSQTVRAVSANRIIEFKIGEATARVNNRLVKLAHAPYVENGRAIVPTSFVQDAMSVSVAYDARRHYMSITSKR